MLAKHETDWDLLEKKLRNNLACSKKYVNINDIPGAMQYLASLAVLCFGGDRSERLKEALESMCDMTPL